MKLLLVRHGESTWNVEGRYQGRQDPPLSARGIAQAQALSEHLASRPHGEDRPAAIVSSPLRRAHETAKAAGRALGLDVHTDERIIEIGHGAWEGLLKGEIAARWPAMFEAWRRAPETVTFPGGESLADVRDRWRAFRADRKDFPSPLLVVTHDAVIRIAVLDARDEPLSTFGTFAAENAAITRLSSNGAGLALDYLNENAYLRGLRADPSTQAL